MAIHQITVQLGGSSPLADTDANRKRIFCFAGTTPQGASTGSIGTQIGARVPPSGQYAYDLNAVRIPSALSVTSYRPAQYDSSILAGQPGLVDQLATAIEKGFIEVLDTDAAISGQTGGAASMAAASGGFITVTGLTGMATGSVGNYLTISGTSDSDNNGKFLITAYNSATSVDILAESAPGNDASNGSLTWVESGGDGLDRAGLSAFL